jgi:hypothetical protein
MVAQSRKIRVSKEGPVLFCFLLGKSRGGGTGRSGEKVNSVAEHAKPKATSSRWPMDFLELLFTESGENQQQSNESNESNESDETVDALADNTLRPAPTMTTVGLSLSCPSSFSRCSLFPRPSQPSRRAESSAA